MRYHYLINSLSSKLFIDPIDFFNCDFEKKLTECKSQFKDNEARKRQAAIDFYEGRITDEELLSIVYKAISCQHYEYSRIQEIRLAKEKLDVVISKIMEYKKAQSEFLNSKKHVA